MNTKHVRDCLLETLKDMYGATMVTMSEDQQQLFVTIDEKKVTVDLESLVCRRTENISFENFDLGFFRQ